MTEHANNNSEPPLLDHASFTRRLAAMIYDGFLIVAIWMLTTMAVVAWLTDGEPAYGPLYQLFLWFEAYGFYLYFWRTGGQTLGMQVWKIRAVGLYGEPMSHLQCFVRAVSATFSCLFLGLGFIWILVSREDLAWHDITSKTRIIYLGRDAYV